MPQLVPSFSSRLKIYLQNLRKQEREKTIIYNKLRKEKKIERELLIKMCAYGIYGETLKVKGNDMPIY